MKAQKTIDIYGQATNSPGKPMNDQADGEIDDGIARTSNANPELQLQGLGLARIYRLPTAAAKKPHHPTSFLYFMCLVAEPFEHLFSYFTNDLFECNQELPKTIRVPIF